MRHGALLEHMQELIEACLGILQRLLQLLVLALHCRLTLRQLLFLLLHIKHLEPDSTQQSDVLALCLGIDVLYLDVAWPA